MKFLINNISDKINKFYETGNVQVTNFLDPAELVEVENAIKYVEHVVAGGFDEAERKLILIGSEDAGVIGDYISVIRVTANESVKLSHRSVLGSLMGLGLKRDVFGDIIVKDNVCDIIVTKSVLEYIFNNLKYVGREKVMLRDVNLKDLMIPEDVSKEVRTTVSSLRVDSVISAGYGISREKSAELVKAECVKINHVVIGSASKAVREGDVISVRGKGRLILESVVGQSRSGRVKLVMRRK